MNTPQPNEQVRNRTRTAILRTAITVLVTDKSAPLSKVSLEAGVARSTLHRYFPDRSALFTSIDEHVEETYEDAVMKARLEEGDPLEAFKRLTGELLERLDVFAWWVHSDLNDETDPYSSPADRKILELLNRGRRDGSMDPNIDARWILSSIWALLLAVFLESRSELLTEHELRELCRNSLIKIVS